MNEWVVLGDFNTTDCWQDHVNTIFYGLKGPEIHRHFQTFASQDYRLPHAIAENYYSSALKFVGRDVIYTQELGIGNGNLASCFLNHLRVIDRDGIIYPKTHYILCDYSWEIVGGVKKKEWIQGHAGRLSLVNLNASKPGCFKEGSIFKIISNELWDDLRTKVFIKVKGKLMEEYLQPKIHRDCIQKIADINCFIKDFNALALNRLRDYPPFIDNIVWECEYRPVDWSGIRYGKVIREMFRNIVEMVEVPINIGAIKAIEFAYRLLHEGGSYSAFDYGMMNIDALNNPETTCCSIFGGQYSFMVNLPLIEKVARFIGFKEVLQERQFHFIQRSLGERMVSVVELVEAHPDFNAISQSERDILLFKTMHILNNKYSSPYRRAIEFTEGEGAPQESQGMLKMLASSLKPDGVPDTVAYLSEGDVFSMIDELEGRGYRREGLRNLFYKRQKKTNYFHLLLIK